MAAERPGRRTRLAARKLNLTNFTLTARISRFMSVRHRFRKRATLACLAAAILSVIAQNPAATVQVDANANRKPISPLIYGANWAGQSAMDELNLTLNRRGGTVQVADFGGAAQTRRFNRVVAW